MPLSIQFSAKLGSGPWTRVFGGLGIIAHPTVRVVVQYLDGSLAVVDTYDTGARFNGTVSADDTTWITVSDTRRPPSGTRYARIFLIGSSVTVSGSGYTTVHANWENISLKVNSDISGLSGELVVDGGFESTFSSAWGNVHGSNTSTDEWPLGTSVASGMFDRSTNHDGFVPVTGTYFGATPNGSGYIRLWCQSNSDIDLSAWADEIDGVETTIPDALNKKFTYYSPEFNIVLNDDTVVDDKTADTGGNNTYLNLFNPLPTRKVEWDSDTLAFIVFDLDAVEAIKKHVTDIILYKHNLVLNGSIIVKASDFNDDWDSAPFVATFDIPEDRDSDPDALTAVDYPSGLMHVLKATRTIHCRLGEDIGVYRYIYFATEVTSPVNPDNIYWTNLFIGIKQQTTLNYQEGWIQGFVDNSHKVDINSNISIPVDNIIRENFKFKFEYMDREDARLARYMMYSGSNNYCFISAEYGNENDWDEIRTHTLTVYGQATIDEISEKRKFNIHSFTVNFMADLIDVA